MANKEDGNDLIFKIKLWVNSHRNLSILLLSVLIFIIWTSFKINQTVVKIDIMTLIFSTLYLGAIYLCISLGMNMTYKLLNFANFSHAEYFVIGAYIGVAWSEAFADRDPNYGDYFLVLIVAFIVTGLIAVIGDLLIFRPLRNRNSSSDSLMISSIGWGILLRNIISMLFGGGSSYFRLPENNPVYIPSILFGSRKGVGFFKIKISDYYLRYEIILAIIVTLVFVGSLFYFLEKTKIGKAMRATSDNRDLAESSGIDTLKMILITWFIGGGLAGVAGILFASRLPIIPFTGFLFLLPAFAIIVLGGIGSLKGSVVAALIVSFSQTLSISYLLGFEDMLLSNFGVERNSLSSYAVVFPFLILMIVIIFKPQGLYGDDTQ